MKTKYRVVFTNEETRVNQWLVYWQKGRRAGAFTMSLDMSCKEDEVKQHSLCCAELKRKSSSPFSILGCIELDWIDGLQL